MVIATGAISRDAKLLERPDPGGEARGRSAIDLPSGAKYAVHRRAHGAVSYGGLDRVHYTSAKPPEA